MSDSLLALVIGLADSIYTAAISRLDEALLSWEFAALHDEA
jgi:hypothetical protein